MEFDAPTFADASLTLDAATKAVVATEALVPGQVIFAEVATVSSAGGIEPEEGFHDEHCDDDECAGCAAVNGDDEPVDELDEADLTTVSPYVVEHFNELMNTCEPHEALSLVDVRKNLFKLLHLHTSNAAALTPFLSMDVLADDVVASLDAAKSLREAHASVIPSSLTDDQVGHLIGVLNKYAIPLDDISGSGLFLHVSKLKHSCEPNASFTDAGEAIWITAIRPIAVGEPITVDFFNTHYMCAAERVEVLTAEGQACTCGVCVGTAPDKTRTFKCQIGGCDGLVHPTQAVFACTKCGAIWDADTVAAAEMEETTFTTDLEADSFAQLDLIIHDSLLHPFHYIFYSAMEVLTDDSVTDMHMSEDEALSVLYRLVDALEYVVPYPHSEKVSLYNSVAQAHISNGEIAKASAAYTHALNVCAIVFGPKCKETEMFQRLSDNTPTTVDEMAAAYGYEVVDEEEDDE
ncbi:hypothetical protein DYB37_012011 [Aphanomyces astaci]|uniref:SET domain-containing protein n=1 Tax=Aphanomyces astaci TaxID=112090 RepID=A0A418FBH6_APHAT|nr:hypothetical protein DYB35_002606 [Aphanomyces astaci]RHZ26815.1 hypothetical protein DYB37_012011 [Aphanomyces astaci]